MIKSFPRDMHAMTQFSMGVLACQPRSHFMQAYKSGVHKTKYWESTLEDCLDLCGVVLWDHREAVTGRKRNTHPWPTEFVVHRLLGGARSVEAAARHEGCLHRAASSAWIGGRWLRGGRNIKPKKRW